MTAIPEVLDARILVITGAGISAESGIPTFRGSDGYWRKLDPTKLATPEAFQHDPQLVWEWYRERRARIRAAEPNPAHEAITRLARNCAEFLLVTQNVDDLHWRAECGGYRLPAERIVQVHGDIFMTRCSRCSRAENQHDDDTGGVPLCKCGALMRPGVVWFGEALDPREISRVEGFVARRADIVLVIGTTALFGYIIDWALRAAGDNGELIEVNPETTALSPFATRTVRNPAATSLPQLVHDLLANGSRLR